MKTLPRSSTRTTEILLGLGALTLLSALLTGVAGLMTSYYIGASAGASITLYLAVWFAMTFLFRKKN